MKEGFTEEVAMNLEIWDNVEKGESSVGRGGIPGKQINLHGGTEGGCSWRVGRVRSGARRVSTPGRRGWTCCGSGPGMQRREVGSGLLSVWAPLTALLSRGTPPAHWGPRSRGQKDLLAQSYDCDDRTFLGGGQGVGGSR